MSHVHDHALRRRSWPVGGMLSTGCARTLEKTIASLPGVHAVSANFATASLSVEFDGGRLSAGAVAEAIRRCGFECDTDAIGPGADAVADAGAPHAHHHGHGATGTGPTPAAGSHAGHAGDADAGGHDAHAGMHHGGDLHAAARDMRRRFLVALAFAIPLFVWAPMGMMQPPPVPFGLRENIWLFLLATGAVL
jgi:Cu2+-exporting ATPase